MQELTFTQVTVRRVVELVAAIGATEKAGSWSKALAIQNLTKLNDANVALAYDYYLATSDTIGVMIALKNDNLVPLGKPLYTPAGDLLEKAANGTSGRTLDEIAADQL